VRCLKAYILKTIALNKKKLLNVLTFKIHKCPTSDIGTLFHVENLKQFSLGNKLFGCERGDAACMYFWFSLYLWSVTACLHTESEYMSSGRGKVGGERLGQGRIKVSIHA
jgi:hypothetical protein